MRPVKHDSLFVVWTWPKYRHNWLQERRGLQKVIAKKCKAQKQQWYAFGFTQLYAFAKI